MIDLIALCENLFESLDKHLLPFLNKKIRLMEKVFEQDFYKKMLILHMEENKRLLEKVNQTQTIKSTLEKNGVGLDNVKKYEEELIRLHQELSENNLKIERLKGKVKND